MSAARSPLFKGLANRFGNRAPSEQEPANIALLQQRFEHVRNLVEVNNQVLALIGDMEEKALGDYLFDNAYIVRQLDRLTEVMRHLLQEYRQLDGEGVDTLHQVKQDLLHTVHNLLPWSSPEYLDMVTLPLAEAQEEHLSDVGNKSLTLSSLLSQSLPVPDGFTITSHAYQESVHKALGNTNLTTLLEGSESDTLEELEQRCGTIRDALLNSSLPERVEAGILAGFDRQFPESSRVVMRSSAIGEDAQFSFAGQYKSVLDVTRDNLLAAYRQVIASKFHANTLYYMFSHGIPVANMPVAVICQRFVPAQVSGVCYTRDPVQPDEPMTVIHAAPGLGPNVVEGRVTPDVYRVNGERQIEDRELAADPDPAGGEAGCLTDAQVLELARLASEIEEMAGQPQDIEFAIDDAGRIFIVQARRLETICYRTSYAMPDLHGHLVLATGGKTACPGAGYGRVVHILDAGVPAVVNSGDLIVTRSPDPRLSVYLSRAAALVTEVGSTASHLATLAREKRVPALFGLAGARHRMTADETVTVDASGMKVYAGALPELVHARRSDYETLTDTAIFDLLGRILQYISPLRLLNPLDEAFQAKNCSTIHDIVRFVHQKGMEALFAPPGGGSGKQHGAVLRTALPLTVHLLQLDDTPSRRDKQTIPDDAIPCVPMQDFWNGILSVGWPGVMPAHPSRTSMKSFELDTSVHRRQFSQLSFAVIRSDYMLFNLRLGYHFTSVEARAGDDPNQNFIRIHYKGGGAAGERRQRRIALVEELLDRMNFGHHAISDFVVASIDHLDAKQARDDLVKVGQLFMHTKQLDMALSNERITRWYTEDIARSLGLPHSRARQ